MANITLMGASYTDVPAVTLPQTGGGTVTFYENGGGTGAISVVDTTDSHGGTVRTITALDISDTTAVAADVAQGKYFYTAQGVKTAGTGSGGTPSATAHTIYFEFSDETDTTITAYYDSTFISDAITATTPTTYGQKTVTLAQLDGVTWYEPSAIPLNTQLIDFSAVLNDTLLDPGNGNTVEYSYISTSDFTKIDPSMTFSYTGIGMAYVCFYNSSKTFISSLTISEDTGGGGYEACNGTLTPAKIPASAEYVRINSFNNPSSSELSLIRTS